MDKKKLCAIMCVDVEASVCLYFCMIENKLKQSVNCGICSNDEPFERRANRFCDNYIFISFILIANVVCFSFHLHFALDSTLYKTEKM